MCAPRTWRKTLKWSACESRVRVKTSFTGGSSHDGDGERARSFILLRARAHTQPVLNGPNDNNMEIVKIFNFLERRELYEHTLCSCIHDTNYECADKYQKSHFSSAETGKKARAHAHAARRNHHSERQIEII